MLDRSSDQKSKPLTHAVPARESRRAGERTTFRTLYLVIRAYQLIQNQMELELKQFSITPAQYALMSRLEEGGISAAEVARAAGVSAQAVTQWIHQLESKGLLARRIDPNNRRLLRIRLTKSGHKLLAECDKAVDRLEARLLKGISKSNLVAFREILAVLAPAAQRGDAAWAHRGHLEVPADA